LEFVKNLRNAPATFSVLGTLSFIHTPREPLGTQNGLVFKKRRDDGKTAEKVNGFSCKMSPENGSKK
jgi:hypothetical protein